MKKKCSNCNETKPFSSFHKNKKNKDGRHYHCKACRKGESLKQYGLTLETYQILYESQEGKCAICKTETPRGQSTSGRFYVDHCHDSGKVRQLLCNDCNTGLGLFKDNIEILTEAIEYLKRHNEDD